MNPHTPDQYRTPDNVSHNHAFNRDPSKKFLNMSLGVFITVLTLCIAAPVLTCIAAVFLSAITTAGNGGAY